MLVYSSPRYLFILFFFYFFFNSYNVLLLYSYIHLFIYYSFVVLRGCLQLKWQVIFSLNRGIIWGNSIFRAKKIGFLKNVLCLRPNLSCRKQKTNPPKIGTSLQIPWMFPPAPLGIAPDACFLKSGFSGSRASGAIPRGAGGNIHGIWRDVPIFGGFVFCFLQFARPTKTSFF